MFLTINYPFFQQSGSSDWTFLAQPHYDHLKNDHNMIKHSNYSKQSGGYMEVYSKYKVHTLNFYPSSVHMGDFHFSQHFLNMIFWFSLPSEFFFFFWYFWLYCQYTTRPYVTSFPSSLEQHGRTTLTLQVLLLALQTDISIQEQLVQHMFATFQECVVGKYPFIHIRMSPIMQLWH